MEPKWHFTPSEREIAHSIVRGESATATCSRLQMPVSRYKAKVRSLLVKTKSHSQTELVARLRSKPSLLSTGWIHQA